MSANFDEFCDMGSMLGSSDFDIVDYRLSAKNVPLQGTIADFSVQPRPEIAPFANEANYFGKPIISLTNDGFGTSDLLIDVEAIRVDTPFIDVAADRESPRPPCRAFAKGIPAQGGREAASIKS